MGCQSEDIRVDLLDANCGGRPLATGTVITRSGPAPVSVFVSARDLTVSDGPIRGCKARPRLNVAPLRHFATKVLRSVHSQIEQ